jgi:acetyl esterase
MRPFILLFGLAFLLSAGTPSPEQRIIQDRKIYKQVMGMDLSVDIFYTEATLEREGNPAIAFFHGGGWAYGDPSEFHNACRRYAAKGFVTFSFSYRLSVTGDGTVPHPAITPVESVKDARSALRWVKEMAPHLNIDPGKVVAAGQSAGGQLALSTALLDEINEPTDNMAIDPTPCALLLYASNVNTMEAWVDRLLGERREEIWSISPYHNLKPGMPPAIEFHGTADPMVNFWIVDYFKQKTLALGNRFEQIPFEGKGHYLAENDSTYATYFDETVMERTDRFLEELGIMPDQAQ